MQRKSVSNLAELGATTLAGFKNKTIKLVSSLSLCTEQNITPKIRALWNESTTTVPRILDADEFWRVKTPSSSQLILETLDFIQKSKRKDGQEVVVYRAGERNEHTNPRMAIVQLCEKGPADRVALFGLRLSSISEKSFMPAEELKEAVVYFEVTNEHFILAPKFNTSDLHIDTSDGISSPVGNCSKIWLMFPPTEHNLKLLKENECFGAKLQRIGGMLEGGIMLVTTSEHAFYLPVGTLHAVFTTEGGYLITIDFTTHLSAKASAAIISSGLDEGAHSCFQD